MNFMNYIINWLLYGGGLAIIVVLLWGWLKPLLEAEKKHAKTVQEKELLDLVERLAETMVASLAGNNNLSGHDKFKAATSLVNSSLTDKGFSVDKKVVDHAVQAAYEKSDLTPTVDPNATPQTGVVIHNG